MLYDSEINFQISCFWDAQIDWKLGDAMNGYPAQGKAETVAKAIEALKEAPVYHFPNRSSRSKSGRQPNNVR